MRKKKKKSLREEIRLLMRRQKPPLCACGCGQPTKWNKEHWKWNNYLLGHHSRGSDYNERIKSKADKPPLCACGCGRPVKWSRIWRRWNTYLKGHNQIGRKRLTKSKWFPLKTKAPLCKCGCGKRVTRNLHSPFGWNIYLEGHTLIGKRGSKSSSWKGGISYDNNPPELTPAYKNSIRRRDNFTCQLCGKTNKEQKKKLPTHHIDDDRHNNHPDNLLTLCPACHGDTKKVGDKAAYKIKCTNAVKKSKRQNPQGHRDCVRIWKENMQIFYKWHFWKICHIKSNSILDLQTQNSETGIYAIQSVQAAVDELVRLTYAVRASIWELEKIFLKLLSNRA